MSLDRAVPSSPGTPSTMGRRRSKHFDLPPRMQMKGSAYYYVCGSPSRQWVPLGSDLAKAKRKWADLDAGAPQSLSVGDLVQKYLDRRVRALGTQQMYRSYHKALADAFPIPAAQLTSQHVALWRELQAHRKVYANGCITLLTSACRLGQGARPVRHHHRRQVGDRKAADRVSAGRVPRDPVAGRRMAAGGDGSRLPDRRAAVGSAGTALVRCERRARRHAADRRRRRGWSSR